LGRSGLPSIEVHENAAMHAENPKQPMLGATLNLQGRVGRVTEGPFLCVSVGATAQGQNSSEGAPRLAGAPLMLEVD
jgi:hypothetical protein